MTIEAYQDLRGEWRWRLVADNGRILADSGEGYDSKSNLKRAVQNLVHHFPATKLPRGW